MRILITNDDGIHADGLKVAEDIARAVNPKAEIWVVAPAREQSGVGHAISYTAPVRYEHHGAKRFAVDGTPADCVLSALGYFMKEERPDLILSGVNRGNNSGENVVYSGTVGAALEGAVQGVPSVALSQYFGAHIPKEGDHFESARAYGPRVISTLLEQAAWDNPLYMPFYNVNFPPVLAKDVKGIKTVPQGRRPNVNFSVSPLEGKNARSFLWVHGADQHQQTGRDDDVTANLEGYVSLTPLQADLTAHHILGGLSLNFE